MTTPPPSAQPPSGEPAPDQPVSGPTPPSPTPPAPTGTPPAPPYAPTPGAVPPYPPTPGAVPPYPPAPGAVSAYPPAPGAPPAYPPAPGAAVPPPGYGWAGGYGTARPVPMSPGGQPLAGFDQRLVAYLLDGLILGAVGMVIILPVYFCAILFVFAPIATVNGETVDGATGAWTVFAVLGIFLFVMALSVGITYVYQVELALRLGGQTYGKKIAKIRIVPLDPTETLTRRHLALRFFATYGMNLVPGLGLVDGLYQLWDKPYQQCLHDKAAKTVVVRLTP